ncbi:EpsG family protein [Lentibacillus sediminis]|uniref:EpsG family protein n=1 Tax=Lentibacillus sediminis TaxID=1940529 RepID=UPI000C1BBCF6|nr:EpsG family protein [Lentibacillus sediminis]
MTLLWINLLLVFAFAFFARYFSRPVYAGGMAMTQMIQPNKLLIFGSMVVLVLIAGLRSNIGDTFNYKNIFADNTFTWEYVLSEKDIGFGALQMMLKNYVSEDPQIMIFTAALITNVLIVLVLSNYSRMVELSLYVYITGGLFLISMNGIRQMLAAAIAFTAIRFLLHGNFFKYAAVVAFASLFHQSALILLPVYFLVRFKAWSKATFGLIIMVVLIVIGYETFSSILFTAIEDTQYANYDDFAEGGANILRVAVELAPLFVAYLGREKLRSVFPNSDIIVNMALISCVFMVVATQEWIFARLSIYFQLYQLILISGLPIVFREKDRKFVYLAILFCYLAFYFYENVITLHIIYESEYLNW